MKAMAVVAALSLLIANPLVSQTVRHEELVHSLSAMAWILETAYELEAYRQLRGSLPTICDSREFSKVVIGVTLCTPTTDPWGTPYDVRSSPDGRYVIASAGSDRKFETPAPTQMRATTNMASDIVFRDGEFIQSPREWVLGQLKGFDPFAAFENANHSSRAFRTTTEARLLSRALEAWRVDHNHLYPAAENIEALEKLIVPKYIAPMPRRDAWETELRYTCDGKSYTLISAGSDRKFEPGLPAQNEIVDDFARDLVLRNGEFVRRWNFAQGGHRLSMAYTSFNDDERALKELRSGATAHPGRRRGLLALDGDRPLDLPRPDQLRGSIDDALKSADAASVAGDPLTAFRTYRDITYTNPFFDDPERLRRYLDALFADSRRQPRPPVQKIVEARQMAAAVVRSYVIAHPDDDLAARELEDLQMSEETVLLLKELAEQQRDAQSTTVVATYLTRSCRLDEALRYIDRHADRFPSRAAAGYAKVDVLLDAKRTAEAVDLARKIVTAEPNEVEALRNFAYVAYTAALHALSGWFGKTDASRLLDEAIANSRRMIGASADGNDYYLGDLLSARAQVEPDPAKRMALMMDADEYEYMAELAAAKR